MTARDRQVLALLAEHFTVTTSQLAVLVGFGSLTTARHRLATLHARGVLHRARPFRPGGGSFEWQWMLGPVGARIVAAEHGVTPLRPAKIAARWRRLFHGWRWEELAAQHAWFCALVAAARAHNGPGGELMAWRSPWRVSRAWQATTDGHGLWRFPDGALLSFLLLLDDPPRIGLGELRDRLTSIPDPTLPLPVPDGFPDKTVTLIWCATLTREQRLRHAITTQLGNDTSGLAVALGCADYAHHITSGPLGRVWLPLGVLNRRPGRLTLREITTALHTTHPQSHPSGRP
ncbi:hypothetical protein GCM10012275_02330 [Longimycelium tulufanense]|uniref:Uncharacterized protein n=1 Tax=Longimycelium tulufanense TaxID=907463 RepID=A0A8J3FT11_9PSEU|nr:replication-relaxation family protein [Longimycelium tulufanense]GGM34582.1 hypothetical protein GCM10012275_02330 [Longimycelium tulufanense]